MTALYVLIRKINSCSDNFYHLDVKFGSFGIYYFHLRENYLSSLRRKSELPFCSSVKIRALSFIILLSSCITPVSRSTFIRSLPNVTSAARSKNPIALKRHHGKISYRRGDSQMDAVFGVILYAKLR